MMVSQGLLIYERKSDPRIMSWLLDERRACCVWHLCLAWLDKSRRFVRTKPALPLLNNFKQDKRAFERIQTCPQQKTSIAIRVTSNLGSSRRDETPRGSRVVWADRLASVPHLICRGFCGSVKACSVFSVFSRCSGSDAGIVYWHLFISPDKMLRQLGL